MWQVSGRGTAGENFPPLGFHTSLYNGFLAGGRTEFNCAAREVADMANSLPFVALQVHCQRAGVEKPGTE